MGSKYTQASIKAAVRMWQLAPLKLNKIKAPALSSNILIGRVLPGRTPYEEASGFNPGDLGLMKKRNHIEVRVPYYVYDDYYRAFFEHEWDFNVKDKKGLANEGDIVVINELVGHEIERAETLNLKETVEGRWWEPKKVDKDVYAKGNVTHEVLEVMFKLGDVIEPTSNQPVVGERYRQDIEKLPKMFGQSKSDFDYKNAKKRKRGDKNKRDFTERRTYKKWHQFKHDDPYAIIS